jgi:hypothetical protein
LDFGINIYPISFQLSKKVDPLLWSKRKFTSFFQYVKPKLSDSPECHSEEPIGDEESQDGDAPNRFFPFVSLRVRMTRREPNPNNDFWGNKTAQFRLN